MTKENKYEIFKHNRKQWITAKVRKFKGKLLQGFKSLKGKVATTAMIVAIVFPAITGTSFGAEYYINTVEEYSNAKQHILTDLMSFDTTTKLYINIDITSLVTVDLNELLTAKELMTGFPRFNYNHYSAETGTPKMTVETVDDVDIYSLYDGYDFNYTLYNTKEDIEYTDAFISDFISANITTDMDDLEKMRIVYDLALNIFNYDYENVSDIIEERNMALGIQGTPVVCQGYALFMDRALNQLGFQTDFQVLDSTGDGLDDHVRNKVYIDGQWYYSDATWGDTGGDPNLYSLFTLDENGKAVPAVIEVSAPVISVSEFNTTPTNQDVTITAKTDKGTLNFESYTFTENGNFEFIATDGDLTTSMIVTVDNIDKIAPVITIGEYDNTPTNQNVIVTATTNEGTLNEESYTFTENGSFEFVAVDVAGNETRETVIISNIDKIAPVITIGEYDNTPTNQDVKVTATTNEGILNEDSYTFTENGSFEFVAVDVAGNETRETVIISNIDKIAPEITIGEYDNTPTNQNITVTATTNEGILNEDSYTFTENGSYEFVAVDVAGNENRETVTISNIDKIAPVITIGEYDNTPTNQDVTVTATSNEGILNKDSYTFTENGSFEFVAVDVAGNVTSEVVTISNIVIEEPVEEPTEPEEPVEEPTTPEEPVEEPTEPEQPVEEPTTPEEPVEEPTEPEQPVEEPTTPEEPNEEPTELEEPVEEPTTPEEPVEEPTEPEQPVYKPRPSSPKPKPNSAPVEEEKIVDAEVVEIVHTPVTEEEIQTFISEVKAESVRKVEEFRNELIKKDPVFIAPKLENSVMMVNGIELMPDVKPVLVTEGKVLLPIRFIADGFGFNVEWLPEEGETKTGRVVLDRDGLQLIIDMNSQVAFINGIAVEIDMMPELRDGRTYLSIETIIKLMEIQIDIVETEEGFELNFDEIMIALKE